MLVEVQVNVVVAGGVLIERHGESILDRTIVTVCKRREVSTSAISGCRWAMRCYSRVSRTGLFGLSVASRLHIHDTVKQGARTKTVFNTGPSIRP